MKNLKKILAWVLLVCMVLTLASCGKKDEEKETGNTAATPKAPQSRRFATAMEDTLMEVDVQGDTFTLSAIHLEDPYVGSYVKQDNGTYVFESAEEWGGVFLKDLGNGYYSMVACEKNQGEFDEDAGDVVVKLVDDKTFEWHDYMKLSYTYSERNGYQIICGKQDEQSAQLWVKDGVATSYEGESGKYSVHTSGGMQLVDISVDGSLFSGTLEENAITLKVRDETVVLTAISKGVYAWADGDEEVIIELSGNGMAQLLQANEYSRMSGVKVNFESGKLLELYIEDELNMAFRVSGDTLVIPVSPFGGREELVLQEVK